MNQNQTLACEPGIEQYAAEGVNKFEEVLTLEAALHPPLAAPEHAKPVAMEAASLPIEERIQARFKQRFLGAIGLAKTVEIERGEDIGPTLATAIGRAAEGDPEANALVEINIATAATEGLFKDNYVSRVVKTIDASGDIAQFGLDMHQMHLNSYTLRSGRPEELRQFTLAEGLNGYREQAYLDDGLLDEHIMVVATPVPDDLPEEMLDHRGEGFFTRTMTYGLQGTTKEGDVVVTETAFRRGTTASEDAPYEERQAKRIDLEAIGMFYEWLEFEAPKTPLEFLQRPLLLKKSEFPNGIVDVLRRCDIASDVLQDIIQNRSEETYRQLKIDSAAKDASLDGVKARIKTDLLAAAGTFKKHEDANHLLWDLVREHGVMEAGTNHAIDAAVFGPLAARYIEEARIARMMGDITYLDKINEAVEVAAVTGCGGGSCGLVNVDPSSGVGKEMAQRLNKKAGDSMVHYPKSRCKVCKEVGGVVYVIDQDKPDTFNVGCKFCKATKIGAK